MIWNISLRKHLNKPVDLGRQDVKPKSASVKTLDSSKRENEMKNTALMTFAVLMTITSATFAGPMESKSRTETRGKEEVRAERAAGKAQTEAGRHQEMVEELTAMTGGQVAAGDMNTAVNRILQFQDGDKQSTINIQDVAQEVRRVKSEVEKTNGNDLNADGKALLKQKQRALEIVPRFLASARSTSRAQAQQKQVSVFAKQLSLVHEMMTSMKAEELQSHLDVMELANDHMRGEVTGDEAYIAGLKAKYGDAADKKMEEILGCQRG